MIPHMMHIRHMTCLSHLYLLEQHVHYCLELEYVGSTERVSHTCLSLNIYEMQWLYASAGKPARFIKQTAI